MSRLTQEQIEEGALRHGVEEYRRRVAKINAAGAGAGLRATERLTAAWWEACRKRIEARKRGEGCSAFNNRGHKHLYAVDDDLLAAIAITTTLGLCLADAEGGVRETKINARIGLAVYEAVKRAPRKKKVRLLGALPERELVRLGDPLLAIVHAEALLPGDGGPAFVWSRPGNREYRVALHPGALEMIDAEHALREQTRLSPPPMIEPPREWKTDNTAPQGGYYTLPIRLFKNKVVRTQRSNRPAEVCAGVNALNATRWRINERVLAVLEAVWAEGGATDKKHPLHDKIPKNDPNALKPIPENMSAWEHAHNRAKKALGKSRWTDKDEGLWTNAQAAAEGRRVTAKTEDKDAWRAHDECAMEAFLHAQGKKDLAKRKWTYRVALKNRRAYRRMCVRKAEQQSFILKLKAARDWRRLEHPADGSRGFWFTYQLDYRGRAYPVQKHLNLHGGDVDRGLLEFAEPTPLEGSAAEWVAVHLAGACGRGRRSYPARIEWVKAHMEWFKKWAADPLRWRGWMLMKKPFQALAAAGAVFDDEAAKHLAVQADCSNSAYQHYSAMLRDGQTALCVNMLPTGQPEDLYTAVCHLMRYRSRAARLQPVDHAVPVLERAPLPSVNIRIYPDTEGRVAEAVAVYGMIRGRGGDYSREDYPEALFRRDILKQSVMSVAYGLTKDGAREQIEEALVEALICTREEAIRYAEQLGPDVFAALGALSPVVVAAKDWMQQCATMIAGSREPVRAVQWQTPLGLKVTVPIRMDAPVGVSPKADQRSGGLTVADWFAKFPSKAPSRAKKSARDRGRRDQRNSLAPGYVHGADAAHLLRVAVACRRAGIPAGGVHDCLFAPPAHMERVGVIVRREFVRLHKTPLLDALYEQLKTNYPALAEHFPPPPRPTGEDDLLRQVLLSPYFCH